MPIINPYHDLTIGTAWSSTQNKMVPENIAAFMQNGGLSHQTLAFILAEGGTTCKPAWGGYQGYSVENKWGQVEVNEFQKNGGVATISFGGANGTPLESVCQDVGALENAIKTVVNTYQVKKLDFDIEGYNLSNKQANTNLAIALNRIQSANPDIEISLTLPALPSGLTLEGLEVTRIFKESNVNMKVNIMAMDYGKGVAPDTNKMAEYTIAALEATHDQLKNLYPEKSDDAIWKMIICTPMIGVNDVWHYPENMPEFFSLEDAKKISAYAAKKGFEIRYWSVRRDFECEKEEQYASPTCSGWVNHTPAQTKPFDYARAFKSSFLLGTALAHQVLNFTETMNNGSSNEASADEGSSLIKYQILAATGLFLATLGGSAFLAKKYGHQISNTMKSAFTFWKSNKPAEVEPDEENHLYPNYLKNYSTFTK